ncbi:hypothetical protein [Planococcus halocryophilus]|uniref:hypothetical protein n=1 Tax=Planococcus halocryophilus TaxID=1215089 RepID=UPI001F0D05A3|nr:hypothetical protein [Planococcus halocryophilus]MCH4826639.1 hypothetical protein [Planococcus halocryophilus]
MKTKYISQLPTEMVTAIYKDVQDSLYEIGLRDTELSDSVESAMNSRLCDLEDTIDITKYLTVEE